MLQIEVVEIGSIKIYEKNAKLHPQSQIEQIKNSIKRYGMNDPIAIWKNGEIIEGHGRLEACKQLGMKEVPIIRLDKLTDKERREYMLVHNQTTMSSGWDFDKLKDELGKLDFGGIDFDFDLPNWDDIAQNSSTQQQQKPEPQFTPEGVRTGEPDENDPYLPDKYDDDEIQQYTDNQENYVVKRRIIITYLPEQEKEVMRLLGVSGDAFDKVVYDIDELQNE